MPVPSTLSILARIKPGTDASLNTLRAKYAHLLDPNHTLRPRSYIPLAHGFLNEPHASTRLHKTASILASKTLPFALDYTEPVAYGSSTRVGYAIDKGVSDEPETLYTLRQKLMYYNSSLRRVMTTNEATFERLSKIRIGVTPSGLDSDLVRRVLAELEQAEFPERLEVDGFLIGDDKAVHKGQAEFTFVPFATKETLVRISDRGLQLKEENTLKQQRRREEDYEEYN